MTDTATDFTLDTAAELAAAEHGTIEGKSPWLLAWRRLRRNYTALAFLGLFLVLLACCALAPVYAAHVAHTGPNDGHIGESITVNGKSVPIVSEGGFKNGQFHPAGVPIGPQWWHAGGRFVLGADNTGRDVAVRLLYGGLTSLEVAFGSAFLTTLVAICFALIAGFYGGWVDWIITRAWDIIWAFPVILLAIGLGTALAVNGLHWGPISLQPGSLVIPIIVIAIPLIPYVGRPLRGQILSVRQREFVEAATAQGASAARIMFAELLPNVVSTVLVFFALTIANNIIFEAGLSFLGAGVQPPNASWGTLISDGQERIQTAPWLSLAPGVAMVLTVLSLNIFGDGLRDALDPRSKVKIG